MSSPTTPSGRNAAGQFAAGNPGRPPGARSRLRTQVSRLLLADFVENHHLMMRRLRTQHTLDYLKVMLDLPEDADPVLADEVAPPAPLDVDTLAAASRAKLAAVDARHAARLRGPTRKPPCTIS